MSKPKYPFEKRLEVVNHYFTTDDGYRIISARFGVPRTQVRTWVALYEKHGEKGLIPKPKGVREGANKRGNSSRLTQSFHFFMFEPIFSPVNALNQPI